MFFITILLILFFLFASSIKILAWQNYIFETQLRFFKKYGLNRTYMFLVGLIEFLAAMLLTISLIYDHEITQALGSLGIMSTSIGAIYFHLKFDTIKDAIPALITLTLSTILLLLNGAFASIIVQLIKLLIEK